VNKSAILENFIFFIKRLRSFIIGLKTNNILLVNLINKRWIMAKYGKKSQDAVAEALRKMKQGKLKSGKSGAIVTSRQQAIAIGLSQARKKGAKVPRKAK
jgi:Family of unknown function (DUF6496)